MGAKRLDRPTLLGLYQRGLNDTEIARMAGCTASGVSKWRRSSGLRQNQPAATGGNPCGECARPVNQYPWLLAGKPVPGWTAQEAPYQLRDKMVVTFAIKSCTLYIAHEKIRKSEGHSDTKN